MEPLRFHFDKGTYTPKFTDEICTRVDSVNELMQFANSFIEVESATHLSIKEHLQLGDELYSCERLYFCDYEPPRAKEFFVGRGPCLFTRVDQIGLIPDHNHLLTLDGISVADQFGTRSSFDRAMESHGAYFGYHHSTKSFHLSLSAYCRTNHTNYFTKAILSDSSSPILFSSDKNDKCLTHWLWGKIPQLRLLSSYICKLKNPIFISTYFPEKWQLESLYFLAPGLTNIPIVVQNSPVVMDKLYFGSGPNNWFLDRQYIDLLSGEDGSNLPSVFKNPSKLYLSRNDASTRRVANEHQLESVLSSHGFKIIRMTDYSFSQQVQLLRGAERLIFIAGSHGALMPFVARSCDVAVITNQDCFNQLDGWEWMSSNLGHTAPRAIAARPSNGVHTSFNDDLYLDPTELTNYLETVRQK